MNGVGPGVRSVTRKSGAASDKSGRSKAKKERKTLKVFISKVAYQEPILMSSEGASKTSRLFAADAHRDGKLEVWQGSDQRVEVEISQSSRCQPQGASPRCLFNRPLARVHAHARDVEKRGVSRLWYDKPDDGNRLCDALQPLTRCRDSRLR